MNKGLSTIGGLLIAFLIAAVAGTIVWTYYTLTTADITNSEGSDVVITSGSKTAESTKDWKSYTITPLNLSFKYPKEWGNVSPENIKVDTGSSTKITFSNKVDQNEIIMGYSSTDMTAGREGASYEMAVKNINKIKSCEIYKKSDLYNSKNFKNCFDVKKDNKIIGIILENEYSENDLAPGKLLEAFYFTNNTQSPVVGISVRNTFDLKNTFQLILESFQNKAT